MDRFPRSTTFSNRKTRSVMYELVFVMSRKSLLLDSSMGLLLLRVIQSDVVL